MIHLPLPMTAASVTAAELFEWLQSACHSRSDFLAALDLECQPPSRTARLQSANVTRVVIDGSAVHVHYRVEFSEFAPCQDITRNAAFERQLIGQIHDSLLVFPEPFRPPSRDSAEEL